MPAGRPKSPLDLPDGWKDDILNLYAEGASDVEIRALIWQWRGSFSDKTWNRWLEEEPEFMRTIKVGRQQAHAWWQRLGREAAAGQRKVNPAVWIFNMKNRYGWKDKQELSGNNAEPISITIKKPK